MHSVTNLPEAIIEILMVLRSPLRQISVVVGLSAIQIQPGGGLLWPKHVSFRHLRSSEVLT